MTSKGKNKFPAKPKIMALLIPQNIEMSSPLKDEFFTSVDKIEQLTKLNFFPEMTGQQVQKHETQPTELIEVFEGN